MAPAAQAVWLTRGRGTIDDGQRTKDDLKFEI